MRGCGVIVIVSKLNERRLNLSDHRLASSLQPPRNCICSQIIMSALPFSQLGNIQLRRRRLWSDCLPPHFDWQYEMWFLKVYSYQPVLYRSFRSVAVCSVDSCHQRWAGLVVCRLLWILGQRCHRFEVEGGTCIWCDCTNRRISILFSECLFCMHWVQWKSGSSTCICRSMPSSP